MIPCGRGVCAAEDGHDGTCAEASGWAYEPPDEETLVMMLDAARRDGWRAHDRHMRLLRGDVT